MTHRAAVKHHMLPSGRRQLGRQHGIPHCISLSSLPSCGSWSSRFFTSPSSASDFISTPSVGIALFTLTSPFVTTSVSFICSPVKHRTERQFIYYPIVVLPKATIKAKRYNTNVEAKNNTVCRSLVCKLVLILTTIGSEVLLKPTSALHFRNVTFSTTELDILFL